jgi:hypothetical protein
MKRSLLLFAILALSAGRAEAGPLDWAKHLWKSWMRFIVCKYRFLFGGKSSETESYAINIKANSPLTSKIVPMNSAMAGLRMNLKRISSILRLGSFPEIIAAIVQRISIFVVNQFFRSAAKNQSVHFHAISHSVETFRMLAPPSTPIPLIEPIKVRGVHDGVLIASKWNEAIGCIERLGHRMSLHAWFHRASFKGPLRFSRYSITALILSLAFLAPVEAGPRHWISTHKRFLLMESAATGSAIIAAKGLAHCRSTGVEKCTGHYGAAWGIYGAGAGLNFAMTAAAEGCWKSEGGKFCNLLAYGGSAWQTAYGVHEWRLGVQKNNLR